MKWSPLCMLTEDYEKSIKQLAKAIKLANENLL